MPGLVSLSDSAAQQVKPESGSPFDSQKAFNSWLEGLPLANVMAVSNELVAGLQELNRSRVATKFRSRALDRLLGPIKTEGGLLDKEYRDTTFPLKDHVDRHGRVALSFYRELAIGYRIVADELAGHTSKVSLLSKGAASKAIHHALCCHEQHLFRLSLLYQEVPAGVWSEIHTLYAFAAQNLLQERRHKELFMERVDKTRIEDVYKRLCLIGVSDLRRLGQRAIHSLFDACPAWSARVNLVQAAPRAGLFEILPHSDEPPQLVASVEASSPGLMLDIQTLRAWLKPMLEPVVGRSIEIDFPRAGKDGPARIDNVTLMSVIAAWGERVERSFKRLPADHQIKMIVGMNGIHYVTAGEVGLSQFIEDLDDVAFFAAASSNQNWIAVADDRFRPTEYRAEVINQSVGGYRLRMTEMSGMHLRVGEVVSLCASSIANRDTTWLLGLVRWIHAISTTEMEVGVAVMGHAVRAAVVLLPQKTDERSVPPFRGLVIDGFSPGEENIEHLLVPGFVTETGTLIQLAYQSQQQAVIRDVRLVSLADRTSEVSRFEFTDQDESDDRDEAIGGGEAGIQDEVESSVQAS